eukprot:5119587-Amphidinium_carterae.1
MALRGIRLTVTVDERLRRMGRLEMGVDLTSRARGRFGTHRVRLPLYKGRAPLREPPPSASLRFSGGLQRER